MTEFANHFHVCGGVGSGAAGMNDADPSIGPIKGQMRCIGGVDVDPRACRDFRMLSYTASRWLYPLPGVHSGASPLSQSQEVRHVSN